MYTLPAAYSNRQSAVPKRPLEDSCNFPDERLFARGFSVFWSKRDKGGEEAWGEMSFFTALDILEASCRSPEVWDSSFSVFSVVFFTRGARGKGDARG